METFLKRLAAENPPDTAPWCAPAGEFNEWHIVNRMRIPWWLHQTPYRAAGSQLFDLVKKWAEGRLPECIHIQSADGDRKISPFPIIREIHRIIPDPHVREAIHSLVRNEVRSW